MHAITRMIMQDMVPALGMAETERTIVEIQQRKGANRKANIQI